MCTRRGARGKGSGRDPIGEIQEATGVGNPPEATSPNLGGARVSEDAGAIYRGGRGPVGRCSRLKAGSSGFSELHVTGTAAMGKPGH